MTILQGEVVQEPFRRSLRSAVRWYNILHVEIEWQVERALQMCRDCVKTSKTQGPLTTLTSRAPPSQLIVKH